MNAQEIFDTAVNGILKQGGKSMDSMQLHCMYRSADGKKCAVGHCISDDEYKIRFELKTVEYLMKESDILRKKFGDNIDLLIELQAAHDRANNGIFLQHFFKNVVCIADKYHLSMNNIEKRNVT